jgi:hypothetical protein
LKSLFRIIFRVKKKWNKALLLDYILNNIHLSYIYKYKPNFSSIFFNAGAHIQHHYFFNSKLLNNQNLKNPNWYIDQEEDPILDMIKFYEENNNKNLKIAFNVISEYLKENNDITPEQFKKELELYSNIISNKGTDTEQVIQKIEQQLNTLLSKTDVQNKSSRLKASNQQGLTNTTSNNNIIKKFTIDINKILQENKITPIKDLPFKDAAFRGQYVGIFETAYKPDVDNIINNIREQYNSVEMLTKISKNKPNVAIRIFLLLSLIFLKVGFRYKTMRNFFLKNASFLNNSCNYA